MNSGDTASSDAIVLGAEPLPSGNAAAVQAPADVPASATRQARGAIATLRDGRAAR